MKYINTNTLLQHTESEIRSLYLNTSFPVPFSPPDGYLPVFPAPQPEFNPVTQVVAELTPVLTDKGHWEQVWRVDSKFTEYTDEGGILHTVQEQEILAIAADLEAKRMASVPTSVSMRQAELALLGAELLDDIEALIPQLPRADQIQWRRAQTVERTNPLVAYVGQTKGLTDRQIDDLFTHAATL